MRVGNTKMELIVVENYWHANKPLWVEYPSHDHWLELHYTKYRTLHKKDSSIIWWLYECSFAERAREKEECVQQRPPPPPKTHTHTHWTSIYAIREWVFRFSNKYTKKGIIMNLNYSPLNVLYYTSIQHIGESKLLYLNIYCPPQNTISNKTEIIFHHHFLWVTDQNRFCFFSYAQDKMSK